MSDSDHSLYEIDKDLTKQVSAWALAFKNVAEAHLTFAETLRLECKKLSKSCTSTGDTNPSQTIADLSCHFINLLRNNAECVEHEWLGFDSQRSSLEGLTKIDHKVRDTLSKRLHSVLDERKKEEKKLRKTREKYSHSVEEWERLCSREGTLSTYSLARRHVKHQRNMESLYLDFKSCFEKDIVKRNKFIDTIKELKKEAREKENEVMVLWRSTSQSLIQRLQSTAPEPIRCGYEELQVKVEELVENAIQGKNPSQVGQDETSIHESSSIDCDSSSSELEVVQNCGEGYGFHEDEPTKGKIEKACGDISHSDDLVDKEHNLKTKELKFDLGTQTDFESIKPVQFERSQDTSDLLDYVKTVEQLPNLEDKEVQASLNLQDNTYSSKGVQAIQHDEQENSEHNDSKASWYTVSDAVISCHLENELSQNNDPSKSEHTDNSLKNALKLFSAGKVNNIDDEAKNNKEVEELKIKDFTEEELEVNDVVVKTDSHIISRDLYIAKDDNISTRRRNIDNDSIFSDDEFKSDLCRKEYPLHKQKRGNRYNLDSRRPSIFCNDDINPYPTYFPSRYSRSLKRRGGGDHVEYNRTVPDGFPCEHSSSTSHLASSLKVDNTRAKEMSKKFEVKDNVNLDLSLTELVQRENEEMKEQLRKIEERMMARKAGKSQLHLEQEKGFEKYEQTKEKHSDQEVKLDANFYQEAFNAAIKSKSTFSPYIYYIDDNVSGFFTFTPTDIVLKNAKANELDPLLEAIKSYDPSTKFLDDFKRDLHERFNLLAEEMQAKYTEKFKISSDTLVGEQTSEHSSESLHNDCTQDVNSDISQPVKEESKEIYRSSDEGSALPSAEGKSAEQHALDKITFDVATQVEVGDIGDKDKDNLEHDDLRIFTSSMKNTTNPVQNTGEVSDEELEVMAKVDLKVPDLADGCDDPNVKAMDLEGFGQSKSETIAHKVEIDKNISIADIHHQTDNSMPQEDISKIKEMCSSIKGIELVPPNWTAGNNVCSGFDAVINEGSGLPLTSENKGSEYDQLDPCSKYYCDGGSRLWYGDEEEVMDAEISSEVDSNDISPLTNFSEMRFSLAEHVANSQDEEKDDTEDKELACEDNIPISDEEIENKPDDGSFTNEIGNVIELQSENTSVDVDKIFEWEKYEEDETDSEGDMQWKSLQALLKDNGKEAKKEN